MDGLIRKAWKHEWKLPLTDAFHKEAFLDLGAVGIEFTDGDGEVIHSYLRVAHPKELMLCYWDGRGWFIELRVPEDADWLPESGCNYHFIAFGDNPDEILVEDFGVVNVSE